jgi:D-galacturonate reductase
MVLCDRSGTRMPAVRATIEAKVAKVYKGLDTTLECFPADDVADDPQAFNTVGGVADFRWRGGRVGWARWQRGWSDGTGPLLKSVFSSLKPLPPPKQKPKALATMSPGDAAIIFTPDDSHHFLASACLKAGLHVLVAKPLVRSLEHHRRLVAEAEEAGTMVSESGVGAWALGGLQ